VSIERLDHIGVVVDDLEGAIEFFVALGLEHAGEGSAEGDWVDRIVGLEGVRSDIAFVKTPDGHGLLELTRYNAPPSEGDAHAPANARGIRHLAFAVDDIDAVVSGLRARGTELLGEIVQYEQSFRLCYVRGPEGIIVELVEKIGDGDTAIS
jgi:catechol 2,3-dioxygenase-like lactoylglutathione lyase family enzyme